MTPTINQIPVGIVSSERAIETLYRTIQSLKNAGFSRFYIGYDRDRSGIWPHYQLMMKEMTELFGTSRPVLIVEDDIIACHDLHRYLCGLSEDVLHDEVGLISLYVSEWTRKHHFEKSCERINVSQKTENIGGALAWLWNPNVLQKIAFADDLFRDDRMRTDVHVPVWLDKHHYKMLHHLPSLVQHADGGCSTYQNAQTIIHRQADTFIGEDFSVIEHFTKAMEKGAKICR